MLAQGLYSVKKCGAFTVRILTWASFGVFKMKIGILTQPLHCNYGGILQAYALQTSLRRMGHDPLVLDRTFSKQSSFRAFLGKAKRFTFKYAMGRKDIEVSPFRPSSKQLDTISKEIQKFVRQYISKTEMLFTTDELKSEAIRHRFDAYIVGSDQVWRMQYSPCLSNYFLDFVEGGATIRRIAYAASFGVDHWHFKPKITRRCKKLAQKFDAISVREDSGINLCRQYLDVNAVHVVDPTMLLEPEDYVAMVLTESEAESAGNLMTYILDPTEEKTAMVERVSSTLGLKPFTVMPLHKLTLEMQDRVEECVYPRVTQWLRGYMDAKFVIVDSFHGCIFAILFNIPFVVLRNQKRGSARFVSLLQQFNLMDRLIGSPTELSEELMHERIDWYRVNQVRSILRELSINFLRCSLVNKET